ncbi:sulfite reductase, ferredoxin dependent [Chamaesiphon minutus]|uniref:Sulfite reductase [ferredoxin] n=1 Tax=Chamaesiphon minutus (strain ATCC 27169 / PCC 6605) TaxID=1173020 RepID=K9UI27_CHAP6|nr:sulfite reductase, ferredoxin dependent [Chamaesiphon minutus]AFY94470.1 ferredoxin-sulfite reductase [Chamaesiphon minutus PCC 6605]
MVTTSTPKKLAKVEHLKTDSNYLREPVASELLLDTNYFTEDAIQILKFHGSYQQDNRDNRVKGEEKDYQMMLRTRNPGGFIPPQLYLALDRLASDYGNETIRATTRQGFQMHGILKKNLKPAITAIVQNMGSTLGACGDLNRNVMAPPAPFKNKPEYRYALTYADRIADLLTPQSGAYYEVWLDGEKVISGEPAPEVKAALTKDLDPTIFPGDAEPLYGMQYMPRKFKIAITVPGDNSIDIFSQDLGLVVITNPKGQLLGFNVYAGGGLGRTHNKEETFARIADPIGYVTKANIYDLVKAIVSTQRDYGDRTNRRHARMKYLIHDWGVAKFKAKVEEYYGKKIQPLKQLPAFKYLDFLGWHEQGDGKLFLGISVVNGRIKDDGDFKLRTALREIVQTYQIPMRVTPHQNVLIYDIKPADRDKIDKILIANGVEPDPTKIDTLVRYSMACPALPTCGLAVTESERVAPSVNERFRALLDKLGLPDEQFVIRMTGCPNGCARPYMAEVGFVGSFPESYQVWLAGCPAQTRLAQVYTDRMHINDLETFFTPMLEYFKIDRKPDEGFGDFCNRVGLASIREVCKH